MTKQRVLAVLMALALFGGGLFLGYRLAWDCPLPPPPPFGAFGPGPGPGGPGHPPGPRPRPTPQQAAQLERAVAALQPQLEAFQKGFDVLENDFHASFEALLTPEQKARAFRRPEEAIDWVGEFNQMAAERSGQPPAPPSPARDPRRLLMRVMRIVMYTPTLHIFTERLALTPDQQAELGRLLEKRRQAFLELIQAHPLPYDGLYRAVREAGLFPPAAGR